MAGMSDDAPPPQLEPAAATPLHGDENPLTAGNVWSGPSLSERPGDVTPAPPATRTRRRSSCTGQRPRRAPPPGPHRMAVWVGPTTWRAPSTHLPPATSTRRHMSCTGARPPARSRGAVASPVSRGTPPLHGEYATPASPDLR